jgi:hypothetical protein
MPAGGTFTPGEPNVQNGPIPEPNMAYDAGSAGVPPADAGNMAGDMRMSAPQADSNTPAFEQAPDSVPPIDTNPVSPQASVNMANDTGTSIQQIAKDVPDDIANDVDKMPFANAQEHLLNKGSMSIDDALKYVKNDAASTDTQISVANKLDELQKKYGIDYNIRVGTPEELDGAVAKSVSDPATGNKEIVINPDYATSHTILHEATHQATHDFIDNAEYMIKNGIDNQVTKDYQDIVNIMNKAKSATDADGYAFKDVHEFISEAFSNPAFQNTLKNIDIKSTNMWDKFVGYVKNLLGFKDEDTLSKVMTLTERNMFSKPVDDAAARLSASTSHDLRTEDINTIAKDVIDKGVNKLTSTIKNTLSNPALKPYIDGGLDLASAAKNTISELMDKTKLTRGIKEGLAMPDEGLHSFYTNAMSDIDHSFLGKLYNKLIAIGKEGEQRSVEIANSVRETTKNMMKNMADGGKSLREAFTRHYLHTDYQAIRDLHFKTMDDVKSFIDSHSDVYNAFKKEIDQGAKALKDRGAMNSRNYYNNAEVIAKMKGVTDKATIDIIDKLISAKAVAPEDLAFINRYGHTDWFKNLEAQTAQHKKLSDELFKNDPHNQVKGYYKEIYGKDLYSHSFDANGIDTKTLKLTERPDYVKGALPINPIKKPIGSEITTAEKLNSQNKEVAAAARQKLDAAGGARVIRDADGNPISYHKVLSERRRIDDLNKNMDAADILGASFQSTFKKDGVQKMISFIKSDTTESLLSTKPKDGYVPLSKHEIKLLPQELRDKQLFVPKQYKHMLIGNEAVGFTEKASLQNAFMNVMKDATSHFKHSVIIASARAYLVNYVGAITACLRQGMSIREIASAFKESNALYRSMRSDLKQYYKLLSRGEDTSVVEARLNNNLMFKMRQEGLSLTMVHDYLAHNGNRSVTHDFAEAALQKMFKAFGKDVQHPLALKDKLGLEDGTYGGEIASLIMGRIDAMGKFAIAKDLIKKGKPIDEAVNEANSIFGNSNKITPRIVQFADQMMFVPFGTWMYRVFAGNMKANKENMAQTLAIYTMFKYLSAKIGYNLNSGDSTQIPKNPVNAASRYSFGNQVGVLNAFHPLPYMEQFKKLYDTGNPMDVLFSRNT